MALPAFLERIAALPAFTRLTAVLPERSGAVCATGLPGSSDALLVAALAERDPNRLVVVLTDHVAEAERWLSDLTSILGDAGVVLYPPREGFGEVEPHAEVAGERVETLSRLASGRVRVLVTTPRAAMERTRLPAALASARMEILRGDVRRIDELAAHLDRVGYERVMLVEDVAQYAVRGGIVDIYGFGMTSPVRLEFEGDDVVEIRAFDLLTQRSSGHVERVVVLPVESVQADDADADAGGERTVLPALWPPAALVVHAAGTHVRPELARTWDEAAHHAELARRRGEDVVTRDLLFESPAMAADRLRAFPGLYLERDGEAEGSDVPDGIDRVPFPLRPPEAIERDMKRLGSLVRDGLTTTILCDNPGQDRKSTRLNSSHPDISRMPSSA